jgi:hypothetical protein
MGTMARSKCRGMRLERAIETRRQPDLHAHTGDRPARAAGTAAGEPVGQHVVLERPARQRDYD